LLLKLRACALLAFCAILYEVHHKKVGIQPRQLQAVDTALPAFAAGRRAAAPLLLGAERPPLSIDFFCPHGAQQQTHRCCGRMMRQTEYGRTLDRFTDPASAGLRWVLLMLQH